MTLWWGPFNEKELKSSKRVIKFFSLAPRLNVWMSKASSHTLSFAHEYIWLLKWNYLFNRFSRFSHVNANFLRFHCLAVNYDDIFTSIGSVSSNRYYNGSSMECVLTIVIYSSEKFGCHFICQILSSTIMRSIITFYMDVNICAVISFHSPLGISMY